MNYELTMNLTFVMQPAVPCSRNYSKRTFWT